MVTLTHNARTTEVLARPPGVSSGLRLGSCFRLVPAGYIDPFARVVDYLKEQIERINRSRTAASSR